MMITPRWKLGCALAAGLCLLLLMSCVLTKSAIQSRAVAPLEINFPVGGARLMAYVTNRPNCPPYGGRKPSISVPCSTESLFAAEEAYTVWVVISSRLSRPVTPRTTFRRLVLLPIE
ncbi:MAG TPA: hypothetical protein VFU22_23780 [Roseiflexaceae bacterium]|nr:hypothetical protein [Roseiflexaceae bacterium]